MGRYFNDFLDENNLSHHGVPGMKWGKRNGPPYPLTSGASSNSIYKDAKKRVNRITSDVTDAVKKSGSKLYGLQNRLKTKNSIQRKIDKKVKEDNLTIGEASNNIKDAIRYTTISSEKDFVNSYNTFKKTMEDKGYKETRCKNYFDLYNKGKVKHKAVQSTYSTKDGYEFEVQFHTPASQDAKNKKIPIYEERRTVGISSKRAKELEKQMENLAVNVKDPIDYDKIKSH